MRRAACLVVVAVGAVVAGGCAHAPPREPDCALESGRPPALTRPTPVAPPVDVCAALGGSARADCTLLAERHTFSPGALARCQELGPGNPEAMVRCLVAIADVPVGAPAEAGCATFAGLDRARCFARTAGRTLSDGQVRACVARGASEERLECLEAATDYMFDPEELHWFAAEAAAHAPPPVVVPADLQARLLEVATLPPDERRQLLDAEADLERRIDERNRALLDGLQDALVAAFPGLPLRRDHNGFLFNFAGGANGQFYIVYCSDQEYLALFGAPIAVNAYSGRYQMDVHDMTVTGRMLTFHEGDHHARAFYPGSHAYLPADTSKVYSTEGPTYMLEYARGDLSSAYDFGIDAPAAYVTRDDDNARRQTDRCKDIAVGEYFLARLRVAKARSQRAAHRSAILDELKR